MSDEIIYDVRDGIAWLTINRPDARNALNKAARDAFGEAAESFAEDPRALVLIITVGGWSILEGALPIQIGFIVVYLTLAFYAIRWKAGVLPIAAALGVLLAIFALVAGPAWFNRDKTGFAQPDLNAGLLGLLTLLLVPVQMLLVAFAMRGFSQGWNVELERREPVSPGLTAGAPPHPA